MTTTTRSREQTQSIPSFRKKYLNDREVEAIYGIPRRALMRMRLLDEGPPFRRFGYKIVLYELGALERWIATLPTGGTESS